LAIEQRDPRISLFYSQSTGLKSLSYDSCNSTLIFINKLFLISKGREREYGKNKDGSPQ